MSIRARGRAVRLRVSASTRWPGDGREAPRPTARSSSRHAPGHDGPQNAQLGRILLTSGNGGLPSTTGQAVLSSYGYTP